MSFEQYRIEWIPNTPDAIRDAVARGGRVLGTRTSQGYKRTAGINLWIDASTVADILSDAGLIAVAFGAVKQVANQARGATKALGKLYEEARALAETVGGKKSKKASKKKAIDRERELETDTAPKPKKGAVGKKKTIRKSKKRSAKVQRRSTDKAERPPTR